MNNATTIAFIQKNVEKLIGEGEELAQMRADIEELGKFRRLIVHEAND